MTLPCGARSRRSDRYCRCGKHRVNASNLTCVGVKSRGVEATAEKLPVTLHDACCSSSETNRRRATNAVI
jgi:hypothetical protein